MELITVLLSSFGVLVIIAIFRWQIHDNLLNLKMANATVFALKTRNPSSKISAQDLSPAVFSDAIAFLKLLEEPKEKLPHGVVNVDSLIIKDEINKLQALDTLTHVIRRWFNWPSFYLCIVVILSLLPQVNQLHKQILQFVGIVLMILASYVLFNFSYNPKEFHGFGKLIALFRLEKLIIKDQAR
jgi:hypothetical protein